VVTEQERRSVLDDAESASLEELEAAEAIWLRYEKGQVMARETIAEMQRLDRELEEDEPESKPRFPYHTDADGE
jgi:hypothetical protein